MALASQSIRAQSMPRSSESFHRGRKARHKRLAGIVILVGLCAGMTYWAVRHRDGTAATTGLGGPAGANAADGRASGPTGPGTTSLLAASPLGDAGTNRPAPTPSAPSLTMGDVREPLAGTTTTGAAQLPAMNQAQPGTPESAPITKPAPSATPPMAPVISPAANPGAAQPPAAANPAAPSSNADAAPGAGVFSIATTAADRALAQGRPLEARNILNRALFDTRASEGDRAALRKKLGDLNQNLVFGPAQTPGDAFSETYRVVAGDSLIKISRKLQLITEPSLIARVNKLANPGALKVGQTLKVVRGPFHAVVDKSEFRMDIYAGPTPTPSSVGATSTPGSAEPGWTYICSFPVGLGAQGLTPLANFTIKQDSKLINPHWANPRTGEKFDANDPKNPIGERWLGLEGLDEKSKAFTGYGIHGTIDPASVGHEMSMGCVRMNSADVELVYELLTPRVSVVKIVP
jgi:LysM repeat protein